MDIYHIWCDLKPGQSDLEFVTHLQSYFDYLKKEANLQSYRIMLDFLNLSDLDAAFQHVATRTGAVETFHHAVNGKVSNVKFALYRDFPDDVRETGGEKF